MATDTTQISIQARRAFEAQDWATLKARADEIIRREPDNPEGYFLSGLAHKISKRPKECIELFEKALALDSTRYDAAIELANQYTILRRNGEAAKLLKKYQDSLSNSPLYLDMAGTVYSNIGMVQEAWPLFKKANELQPGIDRFQANLAACGVYLGKIEETEEIYRALLKRFPGHRLNHYELSRLKKAKDYSHIEQMKEILRNSGETPDKHIFLYYAIGKELEDLEQWDESFDYYRKAGDAVCSVADYDVAEEVEFIDTIMEVCNSDWLEDSMDAIPASATEKTPIFIVGLPRTGTTLTERIVSSHSRVVSLGETTFIQMILRRESDIPGSKHMNWPDMIRSVAAKDIRLLAKGYMDAVEYRLGEEPMFIDKAPFNFLYVGFIAKAWPEARIVHLVRNPMDSCFSMYKQVFTWAYRFSYSLDGLGRYFVAYDRLRKHWQTILGDRLIEVEYEALVADPEGQTRRLLDRLGLEFEQACLDFDRNKTPSTTASSVQVRKKVYRSSVNKWTRFARQLQPLRDHLERAGIQVE
jgi:tetratricopeptide (TPR) repeat protein